MTHPPIIRKPNEGRRIGEVRGVFRTVRVLISVGPGGGNSGPRGPSQASGWPQLRIPGVGSVWFSDFSPRT